MSAILLSKDLLFLSKLQAACTLASGSELIVVGTVDELQRHAQGVRLVLIDLSFPQLDISDAVSRCRQPPAPAGHIVAFGPHVQGGKLTAAVDAGCDRVMTRGELNAHAQQVFGELLG